MQDPKPTGIIFFPSQKEVYKQLNEAEIESYLDGISFVRLFKKAADFSSDSPRQIAAFLKQAEISRLILFGEQPGYHKSKFAEAMHLAGMDADQLSIRDFSDLIYLNGNTTAQVKTALAMSIFNLPYNLAAKGHENKTKEETLVIGGGIAGIQASLEIANSNHKVHLLEKTGTIGGHMAMFDKTFPTLDCAACILTPKMVEVGQHSNIDLMTYSELLEVNGVPGDFKVRVLQKARRVDIAACIGCGLCAEKCPSKTPSEFDGGTTLRKAIYIPFPQAVPNKYLIDADSCRYVQEGKCGVCAKVCPAECIDLDAKDTEIELNVGNIIVATGYKVFDPSKLEHYGYGKYPNVVTSLEFERLINASGPTGGNITFRTEDKKGNKVFVDGSGSPESVAIIHCIGSRDQNHNKYCSRVCCMYSLKLAHLVKEKLPDARVNEYFIDMRAFGKGYEEFYERIKHEGVNLIRGRTAKIDQKDGKLLLRSEDIMNDRLDEQLFDMVILSVGLEAGKDASQIADLLKLQQDEDGWFRELSGTEDGESTLNGGIYIAGACQGPKDIPDAVAQGAAAAAKVLQNIMRGKTAGGFKSASFEDIEQKIVEFSDTK